MEGTVDVIYGRTANAWFQGVKIGALRKGGTLTAQGRQSSGDGYFVFEKGLVKLLCFVLGCERGKIKC